VTITAADVAAVGKRCRPVRSDGYAASHVFVDYMTCRSARSKLRIRETGAAFRRRGGVDRRAIGSKEVEPLASRPSLLT
jgi:hypothetical protein